jgi:hypothetical protein
MRIAGRHVAAPFAIAVLLFSGAPPAHSQTTPRPLPSESVVVTGTRSREVIHDFVESRAAPTARLGKVARWEKGICPVATGLKPELLGFIIKRVKDIAAQVGAPVNNSPDCRHNVEIVFSSTPQTVLNYIRKNKEDYLGFHDNAKQANEMARVTHKIQSWYATATIDANGTPYADRKTKTTPYCLDQPECRIMMTSDSYAATGSRLGDGLHSGLVNAIIVADRDRLVDYEIGTLADYTAFLVLAQPRSLDDCSVLPSILNLLVPGCTSTTQEISDLDLDYLRGVYHMSADAKLGAQQDEITYQMMKNRAEK